MTKNEENLAQLALPISLNGTSKPETWVKPSGFWVSDYLIYHYYCIHKITDRVIEIFS